MINTKITELEQHLVASLLRHPEWFGPLQSHIPESTFSNPVCAKAIRGMHLCAERRADINMLNISTLTRMTGDEYLEMSSLDGNFGGYSLELFRQLLSERINANVLAGIKRIGVDLVAGKYDAIELLDDIKALHDTQSAEILSHISRSKEDKIDAYFKWIESGADVSRAISTPYPTLNNMTNKGFKPGEYVLLGGRAGMGKTSFMLSLGLHAAREGKKVAFISGEMPEREIIDRAAGLYTGCDIREIDRGLHADKLSEFRHALLRWDFEIFECFENSIEELKREISSMIYKNYDMVIIDYLQKFAFSPKAKDELSEIVRVSGYLRNVSLKSNAVFIVASSLNRNEAQSSKITLHSFYGSSKLGHDGTMGLILDGEENDENEMVTGRRDVTLKVAKNRHGPRGEVNLKYNLRSQQMNENGFHPSEQVVIRHYQETDEDAF